MIDSASPITLTADHIVDVALQTEVCHQGPLYNVTQNRTTDDWWYYNHDGSVQGNDGGDCFTLIYLLCSNSHCFD